MAGRGGCVGFWARLSTSASAKTLEMNANQASGKPRDIAPMCQSHTILLPSVNEETELRGDSKRHGG